MYRVSKYKSWSISVVCMGSANIKVGLVDYMYGVSKYKGGSGSVVCMGSANIKEGLIVLYVWDQQK